MLVGRLICWRVILVVGMVAKFVGKLVGTFIVKLVGWLVNSVGWLQGWLI